MDKQEMLRKYLDGELTADQEQEALHTIADDPELRDMLRFEQKVRNSISRVEFSAQPNVPEDFADQVMHKIEEQEASAGEPGVLRRIKDRIDSLWTPQTITWRPAYGLAAAVVLVLIIFSPLYLVPDDSTPKMVKSVPETVQQVSNASTSQQKVWVRFVYVDKNAKSISVAGDFNNWEAEPLTKQEVNGEQVWTGLVPMTRGEHRYMFVKNGDKWVTDPMAPVHREDGFGNKNAVIYL